MRRTLTLRRSGALAEVWLLQGCRLSRGNLPHGLGTRRIACASEQLRIELVGNEASANPSYFLPGNRREYRHLYPEIRCHSQRRQSHGVGLNHPRNELISRQLGCPSVSVMAPRERAVGSLHTQIAAPCLSESARYHSVLRRCCQMFDHGSWSCRSLLLQLQVASSRWWRIHS